MNYLLHNLGYDNPIDFRRIVLQAYKYRCAWLRDDQIDRLGLYDYTRWLPKVCYEQSNLEFAKKAYKKAKLELTALTNLRLKALYEEELKKYEVMHNSQNSYYADLAAKAKRSAEEYRTYLDKWLAIPDTPNWLTGDLIDIYDTAIKDIKDIETDNIKAVERMHNQKPPTFEEFKERELMRLESNISFYANKIKSAKRAIKLIEQECEETKQIFAWLDSIEQKETNK